MFKNFKKTIECIILCIRFPFLYPRNRFTGKHYVCWPINQFHKKWWKHTSDIFFIHFTTEVKDSLMRTYRSDAGIDYRFDVQDGYINVYSYNDKTMAYHKPLDEFGSGTYQYWNENSDKIKCGWDGNVPVILVSEDWKMNKDRCAIFEHVHAKWLRRLIRFFDWIEDHPLQWIHCIPTHTELDAMPTGWRKAFGIQMCKDIKQALLKAGGRKALRNYRIDQIKEKFSALRWYDHNSTEEIHRIIAKYEGISYKTCISCGKPATKRTTGWICPYCDDCVPKNSNYIDINKPDDYL